MQAGAASAGEGAKQLRQPLLQAAARLASGECRRVLRRVRVVENRAERRREAVYARMLAKAAAANPLAVLDTVVDHARPPARPRCPERYCSTLTQRLRRGGLRRAPPGTCLSVQGWIQVYLNLNLSGVVLRYQ